MQFSFANRGNKSIPACTGERFVHWELLRVWIVASGIDVMPCMLTCTLGKSELIPCDALWGRSNVNDLTNINTKRLQSGCISRLSIEAKQTTHCVLWKSREEGRQCCSVTGVITWNPLAHAVDGIYIKCLSTNLGTDTMEFCSLNQNENGSRAFFCSYSYGFKTLPIMVEEEVERGRLLGNHDSWHVVLTIDLAFSRRSQYTGSAEPILYKLSVF